LSPPSAVFAARFTGFDAAGCDPASCDPAAGRFAEGVVRMFVAGNSADCKEGQLADEEQMQRCKIILF